MTTKVQTHNHADVKLMHNQFMFHDNSYKSRIILSLIMFKHIIIKIINN